MFVSRLEPVLLPRPKVQPSTNQLHVPSTCTQTNAHTFGSFCCRRWLIKLVAVGVVSLTPVDQGLPDSHRRSRRLPPLDFHQPWSGVHLVSSNSGARTGPRGFDKNPHRHPTPLLGSLASLCPRIRKAGRFHRPRTIQHTGNGKGRVGTNEHRAPLLCTMYEACPRGHALAEVRDVNFSICVCPEIAFVAQHWHTALPTSQT